MSNWELVDTFPAFRRWWLGGRNLDVNRQLDSWRDDYLHPWPELFQKQVEAYASEGVSWRTVARRWIFPTLDQRVALMGVAHERLRRAIPTAVRRCRDGLGLDFAVTCVIHVGVGCGAGWATRFAGTPAVLFGLENAADLGWTDPTTVVALVEHELAHLLHDHLRRRSGQRGLEGHHGPWWQLYEEGFATRCELRLGEIGAHHSRGRRADWLPWCTSRREWLAARFLKVVHSPREVRRFFGSWYPLDGHIETGYFLGSELIREWESTEPLDRIARWNEGRVRRRAESSLRRIAEGRSDRAG